MALKYRFELKPWTEWPAPIRDRQPASLRAHARMLADDVEFHVFLPHTYEHDCVVYTGTHDNDTLLGWYRHAKARDKRYAREYLNAGEKSIAWGFINAAWSSVAGLAILPLQDLLSLGSRARMNTPGTTNGNWRWRFDARRLTPSLARKLAHLTQLYGR